MKKTLGICGDSFMAAKKYEEGLDNGYGKHFTEILAKKLNCNLITYARGGCSNQAIRLQIDEIIKDKPDHVIIGSTNPDRIEVPTSDLTVEDYRDKWYKGNYIPSAGLFNIDYGGYYETYVAADNEGFKKNKPTLRSETLSNIFDYTIPNLIYTKAQFDALERYFNVIYDYTWKMQQDSWILSDGLYKLKRYGISYHFICWGLYTFDSEAHNEGFVGRESDLNPWKYYSIEKPSPYSFHLPEEDEVVLANLWYEELKSKLLWRKFLL
jgi:hypothetical protein